MATERQRYILVNDHVRKNAIAAIMRADVGSAVTVGPATRSLDQNAKFHAICSDLAKSRLQWAGKRRHADEWKVLLVSGHTKATEGEIEFVPGLEGEFVNVRESTARMSAGGVAVNAIGSREIGCSNASNAAGLGVPAPQTATGAGGTFVAAVEASAGQGQLVVWRLRVS